MAGNQHISKNDRNQQQAGALRSLEGAIGDLHGAVCQLQTIAEGTLFSAENNTERLVREKADISEDDYRLRLWTQVENTALIHSLYQIVNLSDRLRRDYYAGYGNIQPTGPAEVIGLRPV